MMAKGGSKQPAKDMRSHPLTGSERLEGAASATLELSLDDLMAQPLPDNLPSEMFTGPGLLALADLLPVMTGYFDSNARLQFINRLFADWLEMPRPDLVGRTMEEIIGTDGWEHRRSTPMLTVYPALFLAGTIMAFNFLGDGVRDWLDPRSR